MLRGTKPVQLRSDYSLWNAMMREYAEEFLGLDEARTRVGAPIDYSNDAPFVQLNQAKRDGGLQVYVLGVGVDPLNWKFSIPLVCVIEAAVFDEIFADMMPVGAEGVLELPSRSRTQERTFEGWPLDQECVSRYLASREAVTALEPLLLTWEWRRELGLVN